MGSDNTRHTRDSMSAPVLLTHDEAELVAAVFMGKFGAVALPPAFAHLTAELLDKLPGIETPRVRDQKLVSASVPLGDTEGETLCVLG